MGEELVCHLDFPKDFKLCVAYTWSLGTGNWGKLPNGQQVFFQARPVGRESDNRLIWIDSNNRTQQFWVDQSHAGFGHVVLKYSENGDHVWGESGDAVGASLDVLTGDFRPERMEKRPWAVMGTGKKLAEGYTWRLIWLFGPW